MRNANSLHSSFSFSLLLSSIFFIPLVLRSFTNSCGVKYVFMNGNFVVIYKQKRPAHLSIVERLGGFSCCKDTNDL